MAAEFRCRACGAEFESKNQLDAHDRSQHPSGNPQGEPGGGGSNR